MAHLCGTEEVCLKNIGEILDFLNRPPVSFDECVLCHLPEDTPVIRQESYCRLIRCPVCGRFVAHLLEHRSIPVYDEMEQMLSVCTYGQRKNPHKTILDFSAEFSGHFSIHITEKVREIATMDLAAFWKVYIKLYRIMYAHLQIARPEAIYKNRIIRKKAEGFPLFDLFQEWTEAVRLSADGEMLFRYLSMFYHELS